MDSTVTPTGTLAATSDDTTADHGVAESSATSTPAAADELLIEEISIDGMCGVY